jgi:2-methylisocitrate lyase-like PEP mutase family enzyme
MNIKYSVILINIICILVDINSFSQAVDKGYANTGFVAFLTFAMLYSAGVIGVCLSDFVAKKIFRLTE